MSDNSRLNAANNVETTLAEDITDTATEFDVADTSSFPETPFRATISEFDEPTNLEIVEVTSVDGDTITVDRGVEDTTGRSFSSGDNFEQRFTAGAYDELVGEQVFDGHGNEVHSETFATVDESVENFSTQGAADTVPVSQGDGTLAMQEMEGGAAPDETTIDLNEDGELTVIKPTKGGIKTDAFEETDVDDDGDGSISSTESEDHVDYYTFSAEDAFSVNEIVLNFSEIDFLKVSVDYITDVSITYEIDGDRVLSLGDSDGEGIYIVDTSRFEGNKTLSMKLESDTQNICEAEFYNKYESNITTLKTGE